MLFKSFVLISLAFCISHQVNGLKFSNVCELKKQLQKYDLPGGLANWVCLVMKESDMDTEAVLEKANNGTKGYGLFQVLNGTWCDTEKSGGLCNAECKTFINNDLTGDVACVKKVYAAEGFNAWSGWVESCKGKELPNISSC